MNNNDIKNSDIKEKNLAYGGQALIEGVLMRGQSGFAFTVKKPDDTFYKEKKDYSPISKKIKFFGFPLIRGVIGLFENLIIGMKVLNKSAEIAFPEEENQSMSTIAMFFLFLISLIIGLMIFTGIPYMITPIFKVNHNSNPILYNLISGIIRMIMFFIYLISISFLKDTKRLFGYHGAEHKTIHTYESKLDLTVENVKAKPRLHPRCGTSFVFIVFIITIVIFPLFNIFFNTQQWYNNINKIPEKISAYEFDMSILSKIKNEKDRNKLAEYYYRDTANGYFLLKDNLSKNDTIILKGILEKIRYNFWGRLLQRLIHIFSHIFIGMPIVAAISYELLKLSQKHEKNPLVKLFIAPGLFFQLFTTREPDDTMIKAAILSLKMVLGEEELETARNVSEKLNFAINPILSTIIYPIFIF